MYQWDSVRNNTNALDIAPYFDRILTFDMKDAKDLGWIYRPLFFTNALAKEKIEYDMAMVGTLYYKRAELLKKVKALCKEKGWKIFDYLYSQKIVYVLHKNIMKDKRYADISKDEVKFESLPSDKLKDIYSRTNILIDYAADDQAGLTMRTIESIGYRCKLVTNNKNVKTADFYSEDNIYIYDMDNFDIPDSFVESGYRELPENIYRKYTLAGWTDTIFDIQEGA